MVYPVTSRHCFILVPSHQALCEPVGDLIFFSFEHAKHTVAVELLPPPQL